jgi:magnesium-transporting ATPase (P-type)
VLAEKIGLPEAADNATNGTKPLAECMSIVSDYWLQKFSKVGTHEFTRGRKAMAIIVYTETLIAKGACELILEQCNRYPDDATGEVLELDREAWVGLDASRHNEQMRSITSAASVSLARVL